jgi:O-antigen/teichoic acid export membrane protein
MNTEIGPGDARPLEVPPAAGARGVRLLARAASGSFALNVVNTGATVLTTIILARAMDVAGFGIYSWVVGMVTLLSVPAILGVDRLLIRDIAVYVSREAFGNARGLLRRTTQLVLATSTLLAVGGAIVALLAVGTTQSASLVVFVVGMIALPFLALSRVVQSALMGLHHVVLAQVPEYALRPLLFLGLIGLALLGIGPPLEPLLVVGLFAVSLAATLLASIALLATRRPPAMRHGPPAYDTRAWVGASVALAFLSGAAVVNSQTGVVLLGVLDGPESAGLYAVAQRGALLIGFPLVAVNTALAPTAARLWAAGEADRLQRLVTTSARGALLGALPIALVFMLFGDVLLSGFFGPPFVPAAPALSILSIGQLTNAATGSVATLLVMTGNQRRAAMGITSGAVLNVGLATLLIPAVGLVGAAVAAAASLIVSNLILVALTQRSLHIHPTAFGRLGIRRAA